MKPASPAPRSDFHSSLLLGWPSQDRERVLSLLRDYLDRPANGRLRPILAGEFHDWAELWSQDGFPV
jgi:hypothetical protein